MTPPDLAARVAALLDAGLPGHVRDLFEDMAAELGSTPAAVELRSALACYRVGCLLRGDGVPAPNAGHAAGIMAELWRKIDPASSAPSARPGKE